MIKKHGLFTEFFRNVSVLTALTSLGILLTIARGDRVGVTVMRAEPQDEAHSRSILLLQFSADMNRESVEERLELEPLMPGEWLWSGRSLRFQPTLPWPPGEEYRLTLAPGAQSRWGRELLQEITLNFRIRLPRVLWLGPADQPPYQIYLADTERPDEAQPITNMPAGVYDFAISSDGTKVVYSAAPEKDEPYELFLLNLADGFTEQITQCGQEDATCTQPNWRPGRAELAYERVQLNRQLSEVGTSPTRVWLLELTGAPRTRPLFADSQQLGHSPKWSADGQTLTVYDPSYPESGIVVVSMSEEAETQFVPNNSGTGGALAPNGQTLLYPEVQVLGDEVRTILRRAELAEGVISDFTPADSPVEDTAAAWHPDGQRLLLTRRYHGGRWTHAAQLYLMDVQTGEIETLVFDGRYNVSDFSFDAAGTRVLMHRFPILDEDGRYNDSGLPEIWWLELKTGELRRVAVNGFHPRWLP